MGSIFGKGVVKIMVVDEREYRASVEVDSFSVDCEGMGGKGRRGFVDEVIESARVNKG